MSGERHIYLRTLQWSCRAPWGVVLAFLRRPLEPEDSSLLLVGVSRASVGAAV